MAVSNMTVSDVLKQSDFTFAICAFADEFAISDNKYEMVKNEPDKSETDKLNLCILAAVVHKLSKDYNINAPKWINDNCYKMPYPVYSFDTKNTEFQKFLVSSTPMEFASKNVFYGENAIARV